MPTPEREVFLYVDETGTDKDAQIVALACAVVDDPAHVRMRLTELRSSIESDLFLERFKSVREGVRNAGFHFTFDHPEIRQKVISAIKDLSFDGYICFARRKELQLEHNYEWYGRLLAGLLYDRLRDNVHNAVQIVLEQIGAQCGVVAGIALERLVERIEGGFRPFAARPTWAIAGKDEPCLVLADYLNGVFREAATGKGGDSSRANLQRMRPRIRLVQDFTRRVFYDRRNEIPIPLPP